jgi:hypothetical protein
MNKMKIFENKEFGEVRTLQLNNEPYFGFVYAIECDNGYVKIGSTTNPYRRLKELKNSLCNYGGLKFKRIAITKKHTNYFNNEKILDNIFSLYSKNNTELFKVDFNDVIDAMKTKIILLDESQKMEQNCINAFTIFKNIVKLEKKEDGQFYDMCLDVLHYVGNKNIDFVYKLMKLIECSNEETLIENNIILEIKGK